MHEVNKHVVLTKFEWTLASGSPRRLDILRQVGINPAVRVADVDEEDNGASAEELAIHNAEKKLNAVLLDVSEGFVLAADTMVLLDGEILGKPSTEEAAMRSLRALQNRTHSVITGWALHHVGSNEHRRGVESTDVRMRAVSDEELHAYVRTGEPMDKAGAYGIQGAAAAFVDAVNGCYFNVVGLPISRILREAAIMVDSSTSVSIGGEDAVHG
jgi:septum formation protein